MSARDARKATGAAARRAALRRTASVGLGLGLASLPVLQSTGVTLASDSESVIDDSMDMMGINDIEEESEEDEPSDTTRVMTMDQADGAGLYELEPDVGDEAAVVDSPLAEAGSTEAQDSDDTASEPDSERETSANGEAAEEDADDETP